MAFNRVCVLGSSSGRNAGDAALIAGIMEALDNQYGRKLHYQIPTISPSFVNRAYPHQLVEPVSLMPWTGSVKILGIPTLRSILRSDLSVVFDAVLFDRALFNPLFNFLSTFWLLFPYAKKAGKKLAFYNIGAGPVRTPLGQRMLREVAEMMDVITVRDQDSFDLLREIGVTNPNMVVTADAALNVAACSNTRVEEILDGTGLPYRSEEIIAININSYLDSWAGDTPGTLTRETFLQVFTSTLNKFVERYKTPILFVSTQHNDIEITSELMQRVNKTVPMAHITNKVYLHDEIKGVLSRMGLLIGMRLHAMILGSSGFCPIAGLAYQPKNNYYFRELGIPERCMSFQHFNEPKLYDHISSAWDDRKSLKEHLLRRIPELQQKALIAATLIHELDRGTPIAPLLQQLANPKNVSAG